MDDETRGYKDLIAWQKGMALAPAVYRLIKKLPREERYGLADQIRRAVVSIPANIAEGQARQHRAEFLQHLAIARASLAELDTLLLLTGDLGYLSTEDLQPVEVRIKELRLILQGLMRSLRNRPGH